MTTEVTTTDKSSAASQAEYKEGMQALMREAGPRLFMAYYERLTSEPDQVKTDDLRKAVELVINATDAALERKTDANAHLPVFNITFDMKTGAMAETPVIQQVRAEEIEDAVEVAPRVTQSALDAEMAEMFALLDDALKS